MSDVGRIRRCGVRATWSRSQAGVSLVEVLVAVMVLGVGLLGVGAMQAIALRNGQSSLERTQAVIQSYAILDLIRANRTNALAGYYNTGATPVCEAGSVDPDDPAGEQAAQNDVNAWLASLKSAMGSGATDTTTCGAVNCAANAIGGATCTVTIQWDDSRGTASGGQTGAGGSQRQVVTVAAI